MALWLCGYVAMQLCGYMAMWLCGYVAKWLHWGNRHKVTGEPLARRSLTDLSSELLEPQGKPGWGTKDLANA